MPGKPNLFRRMLDALVEGRQRSAQRYLEAYHRDHQVDPARRNGKL